MKTLDITRAVLMTALAVLTIYKMIKLYG